MGPSDLTRDNKSIVSSRFNASDADITFKSSDGILFRLHGQNLSTHSDIFPSGGLLHPGDIVDLPESSEVLEIFFQYFYRQRQPDLRALDFRVLAGLAEAVEKYDVFAAITICRDHMEKAIPEHPIKVFHYAMKHHHDDLVDLALAKVGKTPMNHLLILSSAAQFGYPNILDAVAPLTLSIEAEKAYRSLPLDVYVAWTRYVDGPKRLWLHTIDVIASLTGDGATSRPPLCPECLKIQNTIEEINAHRDFPPYWRAWELMSSLRHDNPWTHPWRGICVDSLFNFAKGFVEDIENMPKFTSLLDS